MISRDNYFEPHIRDLQAASKGDPGLIERTLYAFGLLEALTSVGMDFIFKGGTSLLLLLPNPKRLSTDMVFLHHPVFQFNTWNSNELSCVMSDHNQTI